MACLHVPICRQVHGSNTTSDLMFAAYSHPNQKILYVGERPVSDEERKLPMTFIPQDSPIPDGNFDVIVFSAVKVLEQYDVSAYEKPGHDLIGALLPRHVTIGIEVPDIQLESLQALIAKENTFSHLLVM